jgi:5-methylcytosine-specific restriction endonuclease McrA
LRAVADDVRFCDECAPVKQTADDGIREHTLTDRERYARLYSSLRWHRVRVAIVREQPLCRRCGLSLTEIVDHIIPAGVVITQARDSGLWKTDRFAGFFFRSNLQGLCRECHWLKTMEDKTHTGPWPNAVEAERAKPKVKYWF